MSLFRSSFAAAALPLFASPALAQSQMPTQFTVEFSTEAAGEEQVVERGEPILLATLRPELAVELMEAPDDEVLGDIGASRDNPPIAGTRLYGSSNRPSLYCHMITDRLVASGGTCFRDFDGDGAFEQGVELEAPSLNTSVVVLDQNGNWNGGTFVDRERLRPPLAYRPVPAEDVQSWPGHVFWSANVRRVDPEDYPVDLTFYIAPEDQGGKGSIAAECFGTVVYDGSPVSLQYYGNEITVLGFNEEGDMLFVAEPAVEPVTVGFIFRFEIRNAYVAFAQAHNNRPLPCTNTEIDAVPEGAAIPDPAPASAP